MLRPTGFETSLGRIAGRPAVARRLALAETVFFRDALSGVAIEQPIFLTGLARAGTTILLELLSKHPMTAGHRYRDYPLPTAPLWWNRFQSFVPRPPPKPTERAHGDGIVITPDSPEAMDEPLWMAFFPELHDPRRSAVLDGTVENRRFEAAYRAHIKKLLWLRNGRRYLAKGNYNVTRLSYLAKLFADARFVLAVREPAQHIASLMRQHARFRARGAADPEVVAHMRQVGHFEFGLDRRPIHCGDDAATARVLEAWERGEEVAGWALYWADVHRHLDEVLRRDQAVAQATLVVRHEDLCARPGATLARLFDHCALPLPENQREALATSVSGRERAPDFDAAARALIAEATGEIAARFGYEGGSRKPRSAGGTR